MELGSRLIPFHEGWQQQRTVHAEVVAGLRPSTLLLVEHEPVYTVGRRAHSWERPDGDVVEPGHVPVVDVDRGGKTTWHGPGQLTVYPILHLAQPIDVIRYVRALEAAVIDLCTLTAWRRFGSRPLGSLGAGRSCRHADAMTPGQHRRTERKICALGVRVARGVTMHGIGLNVDPDLDAFSLDRIIPCGIDDAGVTSLSTETGRHLETSAPANALVAALETHLAPLVADAT